MVSLELEMRRGRERERLDEADSGVKSERIRGSKWPHSMMAVIVREQNEETRERERREKEEKCDGDGMNGLNVAREGIFSSLSSAGNAAEEGRKEECCCSGVLSHDRRDALLRLHPSSRMQQN